MISFKSCPILSLLSEKPECSLWFLYPALLALPRSWLQTEGDQDYAVIPAWGSEAAESQTSLKSLLRLLLFFVSFFWSGFRINARTQAFSNVLLCFSLSNIFVGSYLLFLWWNLLIIFFLIAVLKFLNLGSNMHCKGYHTVFSAVAVLLNIMHLFVFHIHDMHNICVILY